MVRPSRIFLFGISLLVAPAWADADPQIPAVPAPPPSPAKAAVAIEPIRPPSLPASPAHDLTLSEIRLVFPDFKIDPEDLKNAPKNSVIKLSGTLYPQCFDRFQIISKWQAEGLAFIVRDLGGGVSCMQDDLRDMRCRYPGEEDNEFNKGVLMNCRNLAEKSGALTFLRDTHFDLGIAQEWVAGERGSPSRNSGNWQKIAGPIQSSTEIKAEAEKKEAKRKRDYNDQQMQVMKSCRGTEPNDDLATAAAEYLRGARLISEKIYKDRMKEIQKDRFDIRVQAAKDAAKNPESGDIDGAIDNLLAWAHENPKDANSVAKIIAAIEYQRVESSGFSKEGYKHADEVISRTRDELKDDLGKDVKTQLAENQYQIKGGICRSSALADGFTNQVANSCMKDLVTGSSGAYTQMEKAWMRGDMVGYQTAQANMQLASQIIQQAQMAQYQRAQMQQSAAGQFQAGFMGGQQPGQMAGFPGQPTMSNQPNGVAQNGQPFPGPSSGLGAPYSWQTMNGQTMNGQTLGGQQGFSGANYNFGATPFYPGLQAPTQAGATMAMVNGPSQAYPANASFMGGVGGTSGVLNGSYAAPQNLFATPAAVPQIPFSQNPMQSGPVLGPSFGANPALSLSNLAPHASLFTH